jgi:hypothetical protein
MVVQEDRHRNEWWGIASVRKQSIAKGRRIDCMTISKLASRKEATRISLNSNSMEGSGLVEVPRFQDPTLEFYEGKLEFRTAQIQKEMVLTIPQ